MNFPPLNPGAVAWRGDEMKITEDLARKMVAAIERNINDRSGMEWSDIDPETLDDLRQSLAEDLVRVAGEEDA